MRLDPIGFTLEMTVKRKETLEPLLHKLIEYGNVDYAWHYDVLDNGVQQFTLTIEHTWANNLIDFASVIEDDDSEKEPL